MGDKLTEKQEGFAFSVAYENMNYTEAYRKYYNVGKNAKKESVWRQAYAVAENVKVSSRIDELRKKKYDEQKRIFNWDIQQAEESLRLVLDKNKEDLERAKLTQDNAKDANNKAIIEAVRLLNDMRKELTEEVGSTEKGLRVTIVNDLPEQDE